MRREQVEIDGVSTSIISAGDGPTIVLLHGAAFGIDAEATWFRTIEGLSDNFGLVSFDQIGFGRTDMPADGVYKNRLERVDHALAVLDHLGVEDACLIGHSEGAFMAARIAIVEPSLVGSLVLVTTGGTAPYFDDARDDEWIAAAEAAYNDLDKLVTEDRFIASGRHLSLTTDSRLEAFMRENYHRGIESGQDKLFENLPLAETDYDLYRQLQERYVLPFLADLDVPTLLLWSANDPTVPVERAELLLEYLAEGELVVIEEAAHNVMIDQTEAFNSAVRAFLG